MAKPYRRRKGKRGPFVGNFRVDINGRGINLQTKDAEEANRRARLAAKGQWPPVDAAAAAAQASLDPTGEAPEILDGAEPGAPAEADEAPEVNPPAAPAVPPSAAGAPPPKPASEPAEPLEEAAAAAAREGSPAAERAEGETATAERDVETELSAVMAELTGGTSGNELIDGVCDGVAAGLLWAERKAIELGWKWALTKRTGKLLQTEQPGPDDLMRKSLRVGLKGMAVLHFPDIASKLTPGWAIAIGMVGGAGVACMNGRLVDARTKVATPVAEVIAEAQQAQQQAAAAPPPA